MSARPQPSTAPIGGRVVVIGGGGYIGARAVRHLLERGHAVDVVTRRAPAAPIEGASYVVADASDASRFADRLADAHAVVYAATGMLPAASNLDPVGDSIGALEPLLRVLEAMREHSAAALVFLSSGGTVYGRPKSLPLSEHHPTEPVTSYGIMKLAAEKYIGMHRELHGLQARILRVANVYGPGQPTGRRQGVIGEFVRAHARGGELEIYGSGTAVRDFIHVDDVATAIELAVGVELPPIMNVGSGVGHSLTQVVGLLAEVSGREPIVRHVHARPFDLDAVVLDTAMFRSLQTAPLISLEEGIQAAWQAAVALHGRPA